MVVANVADGSTSADESSVEGVKTSFAEKSLAADVVVVSSRLNVVAVDVASNETVISSILSKSMTRSSVPLFSRDSSESASASAG